MPKEVFCSQTVLPNEMPSTDVETHLKYARISLFSTLGAAMKPGESYALRFRPLVEDRNDLGATKYRYELEVEGELDKA